MSDHQITSENKGSPSKQVLQHAWEQYANFHLSAKLAFRRLNAILRWLLILILITAALALLEKKYPRPAHILPAIPLSLILFLLLTAFSLLLVVLSSPAINRKWTNLRYTAAIVNRCIYQYRTHTAAFTDEKSLLEELRHLRLYRFLGTIEQSLYTAGIKAKTYQGALPPIGITAEGDDGYSFLDASSYIQYRLQYRLDCCQAQARRARSQMRHQFIWTTLYGIVVAWSIIASFPLWPALIIVALLADAAYLRYYYYRTSLRTRDQAIEELQKINDRWHMLSPEEQKSFEAFENCVSNTERALLSVQLSRLVRPSTSGDFPLMWDDLVSPPGSTGTIPPDITPEHLAAAFEIKPGDYQVINTPYSILSDPRIEFHPESHEVFTSPEEFYAQAQEPDPSDLVGQEGDPFIGDSDDSTDIA